eukprot:770109_1
MALPKWLWPAIIGTVIVGGATIFFFWHRNGQDLAPGQSGAHASDLKAAVLEVADLVASGQKASGQKASDRKASGPKAAGPKASNIVRPLVMRPPPAQKTPDRGSGNAVIPTDHDAAFSTGLEEVINAGDKVASIPADTGSSTDLDVDTPEEAAAITAEREAAPTPGDEAVRDSSDIPDVTSTSPVPDPVDSNVANPENDAAIPADHTAGSPDHLASVSSEPGIVDSNVTNQENADAAATAELGGVITTGDEAGRGASITADTDTAGSKGNPEEAAVITADHDAAFSTGLEEVINAGGKDVPLDADSPVTRDTVLTDLVSADSNVDNPEEAAAITAEREAAPTPGDEAVRDSSDIPDVTSTSPVPDPV